MGLNYNQKSLLISLKIVAKALNEKGRNLTGLIGELSVCDRKNMKWDPSDGYDCIDNEGKKVEIKTRRDSKGGTIKKQGRLGRYGKKGKYNFDYGLYVELDNGFEITRIYKIHKAAIKRLEEQERESRGVHISAILKIGKSIF